LDDNDNIFMRILLLALARELKELGLVDVFPEEFEWIFEELKKYGVDLDKNFKHQYAKRRER